MKVKKYVSLSVIVSLLSLSMNTVLTLSPIQAMASSFDSATSLNGGNGAWTAPDRKFSGTEVDNISLVGAPAFGINDPNAQNGKPAGQYLMLPTGDTQLNVGKSNTQWVGQKMLPYGFNISGTGTESGQPAYSASDIYTLNHDYVVNQQAYYQPGQTVQLAEYPLPSISINSLSQSQNLQPGQSVTVNDSYNTQDNVPTSWGSNAGILAYWNFNGTYTNAIPSASESIPAFGFTPYGSGFERSDQPHAIRNARTVSLNDNAHVYRFVGRELKPLERHTNASSPGESGRAELGKERKSSRFYKSLATERELRCIKVEQG